MTKRSPAELETDANTVFPDNTTGDISPQDVRDYQINQKDSFAHKDEIADVITGTEGQRAGIGAGNSATVFDDKRVISIPHFGEERTFAFKVPYAGTITAAGGFTDTGTINALVRIGIGGTTVTGLSAVALDNSEGDNDDTATAANTFSAQAIIEVVTSGATGSPTSGSVFIYITPTGLPT